ncbi:beta-1,3-glucanase family protein [Roseibium marinum]|uniref:Beta-1,3-glucanase n=1 Tax=Roseibium marinum TaxID=281252 RepID=A0A2S3UMM5_9HYPH|nr:beta-1,3-glucanase family protein [Roseibium marinum]POF28972.1 beta-1,3-glucanase [Roseibium marinum]
MTSTKFKISNQSGKDLYVYDFNYGSPAKVKPLGGGPLKKSDTLSLTLEPNAERRIYFAEKKLSESLEKGVAPDAFNIGVDGSVMFSFAEYNYEPAHSRYTVDLSYIDVFSYPVTVQFSDLGTYKDAVADFEYGPKSLKTILTELAKHVDYSWSALVWPLKHVKTQWGHFPDGIHRVIGPNTAWQGELPDNKIGPWVPTSYETFFTSLPKSGTQLFGSKSNWDGWQSLTQSAAKSPSDTGYVKAMHAAATPDTNGKYGFFCYPRDNTAGEFTYVPDSAVCQINVYPYK